MLEHSEVLSATPLTQTYDVLFVIFSVLIAIFSSLSAFSSAERAFSAKQLRYKILWNVFGAVTMGLGIWSMHFIGMLALKLPIPITYDRLITVLSIIPAICACSIVLWIMTKESISKQYLLLSGVLLGSGIGLMHYIGMAALRLNASMIHEHNLVYLSIVVAIILATVALAIQSDRIKQGTSALFFTKKQCLSATVMGMATSSMHYTAMSSVHFVANNSQTIPAGISADVLFNILILCVLLILIFAILLPRLNFYKNRAERTEERYGNIFENSLTEIIVFNAINYKFLNVNRGASINLGYSQDELSDMTPLDVTPNMSFEEFNDLVSSLRKGEQNIVKFDTIHQRKDGTSYPVEVHLQMTYFLSKLAFVAIILDITERQQANKKIQLSSQVFTNIHDGVIITDADHLIVDVNPSFSKITGYSLADVVGKSPEILKSNIHAIEFYDQKWNKLELEG